MVQEKMSCNRQPVPIRHLQPLSQGLRPCQLPLHRGAKPRGGRKLQRKKGLSALFFYLAESVGFEPTVLAHAGFQDRCLQPLGQLSG